MYVIIRESSGRKTREENTMNNTNTIIAVGSVDGVLTTAALIRFLANKGETTQVTFTQAFTCQETIEFINSGHNVWLVDLAVNNRDAEYTQQFIEAVMAKANLVAVVDEHDANAWYNIIPFGELTVFPQSRSKVYPSSGAVLRKALCQSEFWDDYCTNLTQFADEADQANFVGLGAIVNKAIKASIQDQQRRVYLAQHFAISSKPDEQISQWVKDYETLEANIRFVVDKSYQDGEVYFFDSRDHEVDRTSMVNQLDKRYPTAKVAVCRGKAYDKSRGGVFPCYTFMLRNGYKELNLREILPYGWGMEAVMNVEDSNYKDALSLVKASL